MIYLSVDELVVVAERATGGAVVVRDHGLLASATARPRATAFGADAYPDLPSKAASLMHSLSRNHSLVDGDKRLSLGALIVFLGANGCRLTLSDDEAFDLTTDVAAGTINDVETIAAQIRAAVRPW